MVLYVGGSFYPNGFKIAMTKPWKCYPKSFNFHALRDNVFQLVFSLIDARDRALHEGPWNFGKK